MRFLCLFGFILFILSGCQSTIDEKSDPVFISGVYPHLAVYNPENENTCRSNGDECGIGAVVPWADKLWMITYSPHCPNGSADKLWMIDQNLNIEYHPSSIGGTPANRLIHEPSRQLIIGPYFIDKAGNARAVPYSDMPGRHTATTTHLTDPANMVYFQDMEGKMYEVDVHTLAVKKLFEKPVPGWHAKGAYVSQGRYVIANNGEHDEFDIDTGLLQAGGSPESDEDIGVLAEWDGSDWRIIERRQFCDVTGPGGIYGTETMEDPIWAIGWDKRSVLLKLLDSGIWYTFRLPKATHAYDHRGGWYTEWPRIREVGDGRMLMDMHGMFYDFPGSFSAEDFSGLLPISSHLRYIPDFCDWNGRLVLATDETSVIQNKFPGRSQSNLWFGEWEDLRTWGSASGWGGFWIDDPVSKGVPSDPFLFNFQGIASLHLVNHSDNTVNLALQKNSGQPHQWEDAISFEIKAHTYSCEILPAELDAEWIRLIADKDCRMTAFLHISDARDYTSEEKELFAGLADLNEKVIAGMVRPASENLNLQFLALTGQDSLYYEIDEKLNFTLPEQDLSAQVTDVCSFTADFEVDKASVILKDKGRLWRLPKTDPVYDSEFYTGWPRGIREVESERYMANIHGTFYEIPREAGVSSIRPVAAHMKKIIDFCSWRGLLVLSGISELAREDNHTWKSDDGKTGLWFGAVDDIWKMGKPAGTGGPWKDDQVIAGEPSDPYLMTGYDNKTLVLEADEDVEIKVEIDFNHYGWYKYRSFQLIAGERAEYSFPEGFSAHWIRFKSSKDCIATAWLVYE